MIQEQSIQIRYADNTPTMGQVKIELLDPQQRLRTCLKLWGLCWGGALAAIFIPLAHFVLVPSLLLVGPILGLYKWKQEQRLLGGAGVCPACQAEVHIEKGAVKWPITELCTSCSRNVEVYEAE
jgi:hypothetical protein